MPQTQAIQIIMNCPYEALSRTAPQLNKRREKFLVFASDQFSRPITIFFFFHFFSFSRLAGKNRLVPITKQAGQTQPGTGTSGT